MDRQAEVVKANELLKQQDELAAKSKPFGKILWFERGTEIDPLIIRDITSRPYSMTATAMALWAETHSADEDVAGFNQILTTNHFYDEAFGKVSNSKIY